MAEPVEHLPLVGDAARSRDQLVTAGVDVDEYFAGWSNVLWRLLNDARALGPGVVLHAKEKFGRPTIVIYHSDPVSAEAKATMEQLQVTAEADCSVICQWCSRTPAWRRTDPLVTVACDGCLPLLVAAWAQRQAPVS